MKNWGLVVLLGGLSMLGAFSIDTYLPSFGNIAETLRVDRAAVQQTLTVYLATFSVMTLFYGTLSDSFGRRPVVLVPLGIYVGASLGAAFARDLSWLTLFRGMQGLSAGVGAVVGRAIVRDKFQGRHGQQAMAYVSMVFAAGPALAPIIGGWLQRWWGWRSVFFFLAALGCVLLAAAAAALPETLPRERRQPFRAGHLFAHYLRVASHVPFLLQCMALAFCFGGLALYVSTAPDFIMTVLRLPETSFGWLFIPVITGMVLGSACSGRVAHSIRPSRLIAISFLIQGTAAAGGILYASLASPPVVPWAVISIATYVFGMALGSPAMVLHALDLFPHVRGLAASLQTFASTLLFCCVSGVVAPLIMGDALKLAIGVCVSFSVALVCWVLGTWRQEVILETEHA